MKYAIKVPVDDGWLYVTETDKDGNLIAKTFDTREEAEAFEAEAFNFDSLSQVVEYQEDLVDTLTEEEIEELRTKKQAIKEELYDAVKMEMFKASSKLEGIDYEESAITPEKFKEICLAFEELREIEEKQKNKKKYKW